MIDLQKGLVDQSLCYAAMKKIKSYCGTKHPTKEQVKNTKEKWVSGLMIIKVFTFVKILLIC